MARRAVVRRFWPYDAFISYSHAADRLLAVMVQRCLHRLARPWYRTQALRVFRDETSLAANPDLWGSIEKALADSRWFILLACPESASSEWIHREVAYWQEHRNRNTFLIALTGGNIHWDPGAGDFDWARTDALPKRLRGWFDAEPLWVDLRWTRDRRQLSASQSRFRDEVATLAAAVHGLPKDRLDSEEVRQRRRTRVALAFLCVVLLTLTGGLGYAVHLRSRQQEVAAAGALHAQAEKLRDSQPQTALRLDLAAYAIDPTPPVRAGLVTTLVQTNYAGGTAGPTDGYGVPAYYAQQIRISADGRLAAGIGNDAQVWLWDITDPQHVVRLRDLSGNAKYPNDVAISHDDRTVAIANRDDTVSLWDVADHLKPRRLTVLPLATGATYGVEGVAFSHDGTTLAAVGGDGQLGGTVALWAIADPARPRPLASRSGVYDSSSVEFGPDDRLLVTASGKITASKDNPTPQDIVHTSGVTVWDVRDRAHAKNLTRMPGWSSGIAFSPDGRLLALGYAEDTRLWDLTDPGHPNQVATLAGHTDVVESIAFSPDGHMLATGSLDNTAVLWDITVARHPARLATLANDDKTVAAVRFTVDGRSIVTVDAGATVAEWRVHSPAQLTRQATLHTFRGTRPGPALAVSPDGRTVASADGFAGTVTLWDVGAPTRPSRLATLTPKVSTVQAVAISADGATLAAGGANGRIVLWDLTDRAHPRMAATITAPSQVTAVVFNSDRAVLLASGSANPFAPGWTTLWDVRDRVHPARLASFSATNGFSGAPAFSPDGRTVVLPAGVTSRSSVWDISDPAAPTPVPGADDRANGAGSVGAHPAFSPNGRLLAWVSSAEVHLEDVTDPSHARDLATLTGHVQGVNRAVFAPDGALLATAADDHTTILWDVAEPGQPVRVATLGGQPDAVTDAAFGPGGRWLATASGDTVTIWSLGDLPAMVSADPIDLACRVAGDGLTPDQWTDYAPGVSYRDPCR